MSRRVRLTNRQIDIATTSSSQLKGTLGRHYAGDRIRLAAVNGIAQQRIERGASWLQVVVPQINSTWGAADTRHVTVTFTVGAATRLTVARGHRSLIGHVRTELNATLQVN